MTITTLSFVIINELGLDMQSVIQKFAADMPLRSTVNNEQDKHNLEGQRHTGKRKKHKTNEV